MIAAAEAAVLPRATELGVGRLREALRAELVAREAADRRRAARRWAADVGVRPVGDGMSELCALLPHPEARACRDAGSTTTGTRPGTGRRTTTVLTARKWAAPFR